jgi:hypothetical protein
MLVKGKCWRNRWIPAILIVALIVTGFIVAPYADDNSKAFATSGNWGVEGYFSYEIKDGEYGYGAYAKSAIGDPVVPYSLGGQPVLSLELAGINTIDTGACTDLKKLKISGGSADLNLSTNTELEVLEFSPKTHQGEVGTSQLSLSSNTKLKTLIFYSSVLSELNLRSNTELEYLDLGANELTALNLRYNTKLEHLNLSANKLNALNLSYNTELEYLNLFTDKLDALNLSSNTKLEYLYCSSDSLVQLNLSTNTKLKYVECNYCYQLSALNLSACKELDEMVVIGTQVTSLDLSANTKLETLTAYGNTALTSISLSASKKLKNLNCFDSALASLNLSENTELEYLDCTNSQLTALDLSSNKKLEQLSCGGNQLSALNLSANTKLKNINCSNNQLTALDLRKNTELMRIDVTNNKITDFTNIYYLMLRFGINDVLPQNGASMPHVYELSIIGGFGGGIYEAGKSINVIAKSAPEGKEFYRWVSSGGGSFADADSPYTFFTMPDEDVTIRATYKAKTATVPAVGKETVKVSTISVASAQVATLPAVQWNGKQRSPRPSVKVGAKTLKEGTDYTLSYGANKNIGKGTVTITGKGSYTGSKSISFNIVPKKMSISKLSIAGRKATAKWKKPAKAQKISTLQLSYRVKGAKKWKVKRISKAKTKKKYVVKNLKKGKRYQFRIRAYKSVGGKRYYGPWSKVKTSRKIK